MLTFQGAGVKHISEVEQPCRKQLKGGTQK